MPSKGINVGRAHFSWMDSKHSKNSHIVSNAKLYCLDRRYILLTRTHINLSLNLISFIGKLENVIPIVKIMGHFMNNLYSLEQKVEVAVPHSVKIQRRAKEAKTSQTFLAKISKGGKYELVNLQ